MTFARNHFTSLDFGLVVFISRDVNCGRMNSTSIVALVISCLSFVVSGISLGWNIYKEVYLRARVRTSFKLMIVMSESYRIWRFCFSATNLGPGKVKMETPTAVKWSIWRKLRRNLEHIVIIYDYKHPLGGTLPRALDVGESMQLTFKPEDCTFLAEDYTHIGITDSFGRTHWCNRKDMEDAVKDYREKRWVKSEEKQ